MRIIYVIITLSQSIQTIIKINLLLQHITNYMAYKCITQDRQYPVYMKILPENKIKIYSKIAINNLHPLP